MKSIHGTAETFSTVTPAIVEIAIVGLKNKFRRRLAAALAEKPQVIRD
jgi:hypothetical protein